MITLLAPLGAKYKLQFVPEYSADGTVSVAVIFSLKSDEDAVPKTLSFTGTVAEVEEALVKELPAAVEKLVTHANTLEALDAELKKEVDEKKAEADKERGVIKAKQAAIAAKGKAVEAKKPLTAIATPAKAPEMPKEAPPPPPPAAEVPAGLQPAWKKPPVDVPRIDTVAVPAKAEDLDWSALTNE